MSQSAHSVASALHDGLSLDVVPGVQRCERRDALSASLVGECLSSWAEDLLDPSQTDPDADMAVERPPVSPTSATPITPTSAEPVAATPSLLDQAAALRTGAGLAGQGQTIAVIDTGIAYDHVSLGGGFGPGYRVVGGWDFAENDADPYDDAPAGYHGSHVAGLASGNGTLADGSVFAGVAPEADLVALRVFDDFGSGTLDWVESALQWVHEHQDTFENPITTVNLSIGAVLDGDGLVGAMAMLEDELQALYEDDILVFAATGNAFDGVSDDVMYPASSQYVAGVGSIESGSDFQLSNFSQREDNIFAAEGRAMQSAVPEHVFGFDGDPNDYALMTGTSMASPQVAAASMLVRQAMTDAGLDPTADEVLERMRTTSGWHTDAITGSTIARLNLHAATDFSDGDDSSSTEALPPADSLTTVDQVLGDNASRQYTLDLSDFDSTADLNHAIARLLSDGGTTGLASDGNGAIVIDAGGGADELLIIGSDQAESVSLRPSTSGQSSTLGFVGGYFEFRGFQSITFEGGGGSDRATLFDSPDDDTYRSADGTGTFSGPGFEFTVHQVPKMFLHATSGGEDTAHLTDSAGDDELFIRSQFSSLRGGDRLQSAFGFERVYAYATSGGFDSADLGDSAGDDVMSISATRSMISNVGFRAVADGFEDVSATASQGGDDIVRIYVNDPEGSWQTTDSMTRWSRDGISRVARGFERAETFERFDAVAVAPQHWPDSSSDDEYRRGLQSLFESLV